MAESEHNNFMMKYGRIDHVKKFVDDMHEKGGSHYDYEAGQHAIERLAKDSPNDHAAYAGKMIAAVDKHGNTDQLESVLYAKHDRRAHMGNDASQHMYPLTTDQLTEIWKNHSGHGVGSHHDGVIEALLVRPNVPPSLLRYAASHRSSYIRKYAVQHINAPHDMIRTMTKDPDDDVAKEARRIAKSRKVKLT